MTFVLASQFHIYLPWDNARLALCLNTFLNKKALLGTFNQEKALVLVGAFSVITNLRMELLEALDTLHCCCCSYQLGPGFR